MGESGDKIKQLGEVFSKMCDIAHTGIWSGNDCDYTKQDIESLVNKWNNIIKEEK